MHTAVIVHEGLTGNNEKLAMAITKRLNIIKPQC